jgi:hypothetical protein
MAANSTQTERSSPIYEHGWLILRATGARVVPEITSNVRRPLTG